MRILLWLRFDGRRYCGWQVQPNGVSVQSLVQDALERVLGVRPNVSGCSRTDAGVGALQYACHFDCDKAFVWAKLPEALNFYLPEDVAATAAQEVEEDFHARYSCRAKQYVYRFQQGHIRDPFWEERVYRSYRPLDVERMNEAAAHLLGTHDFSAFESAGASVEDKVRTLTYCRLTCEQDGTVALRIRGDGFLYNMVRIIAGTLLEVSNGKLQPQDIPALLEGKDRSRCGPTLPAKGLLLEQVIYGEVAR